MFFHDDSLSLLHQNLSLKEKLHHVHQVVRAEMPFIVRIAVAIYDAQTDIVKTYLHSSGGDDPLSNYEVQLENSPSLQAIMQQGKPRVVNDLTIFAAGKSEHTQRIAQLGYAASYTKPIFYNGVFVGFLFFNSNQPDVFVGPCLQSVEVFGHLLALMVINDLMGIRVLSAAVKTTQEITHVRDPETGGHLDRMSRYTRLIAAALAKRHGYDDLFVERMFMFAPLHDIGKIAIPDKILLKPGGLTDSEMQIMRTHARIGREMIDNLIKNFDLGSIGDVNVLRNIAEFHHEAINGTGYPLGLKGDDIPLEARIVAVADVFDALTSHRPYKKAWSNDEAFELLWRLAGEKLDLECVEILMAYREQVVEIQAQFADDYYG